MSASLFYCHNESARWLWGRRLNLFECLWSCKNEAWWKSDILVSSSVRLKWSARLLVHPTRIPAILSRLAAVKKVGILIFSKSWGSDHKAFSTVSAKVSSLFHVRTCPGVKVCCKVPMDTINHTRAAKSIDASRNSSSWFWNGDDDCNRPLISLLVLLVKLRRWTTISTTSPKVLAPTWPWATPHFSSNQSLKYASNSLFLQPNSVSVICKPNIWLMTASLAGVDNTDDKLLSSKTKFEAILRASQFSSQQRTIQLVQELDEGRFQNLYYSIRYIYIGNLWDWSSGTQPFGVYTVFSIYM